MVHTCTSRSDFSVILGNVGHSYKNLVTIVKIAHTQKSGLSFENGPLFKSCVTLRKLPQNGSYLEKWVTLRQMIQIRRSDSHSQNWVPLGRQSRLWKNGLQLKNESYLENGSLLDEWVTLGKMGYTGKIKSHLDEWVTLEQVGHIWKNRSHLD